MIWKDFTENRSEMAELICCALELLDDTGRWENHQLRAVYLRNNEELAGSIGNRWNDWSVALRDFHLMAAYVLISNVYLECEGKEENSSTLTCSGLEAFTVLQTHVTLIGQRVCGRVLACDGVNLEPYGDHLRGLESGSPDFTSMSPGPHRMTGSFSGLFACRGKACLELRDQRNKAVGHVMYIRASRGRPKDTTPSQFA